jgi:hypothetical protein
VLVGNVLGVARGDRRVGKRAGGAQDAGGERGIGTPERGAPAAREGRGHRVSAGDRLLRAQRATSDKAETQGAPRDARESLDTRHVSAESYTAHLSGS